MHSQGFKRAVHYLTGSFTECPDITIKCLQELDQVLNRALVTSHNKQLYDQCDFQTQTCLKGLFQDCNN